MGSSSEGPEAIIPVISLVALLYGDAETVSGGTRQHQKASQKLAPLFPLNGRRWLWSNVVGHAVNASNLTDDARRNAG